MSRLRVYDLPTRIFHWSLVLLFVFSFVVAKNIEDDQLIYSYHMLSGLLLAFIVLYRIVWGFVGGHFSRFWNFEFSLKKLFNYFKSVTDKNAFKYLGHNPASSWMAASVILCALGLAGTGILMTTGSKPEFEDYHEILSTAFAVLAGLHIAGMILHGLVKKDPVFLSMIDGKKTTVNTDQQMPVAISRGQRQHWVSALIFTSYIFSVAQFLNNNFNSKTKVLNLFGNQLVLGEPEEDSGVSVHVDGSETE
jgi:cytochrome b